MTFYRENKENNNNSNNKKQKRKIVKRDREKKKREKTDFFLNGVIFKKEKRNNNKTNKTKQIKRKKENTKPWHVSCAPAPQGGLYGLVDPGLTEATSSLCVGLCSSPTGGGKNILSSQALLHHGFFPVLLSI